MASDQPLKSEQSPQVEQDPIHIRQAGVDDLEAVLAFITPFIESKHLLPRTRDELLELLRDQYFVIAEREDEIVGSAVLEIYSPKLAEVRSLAVSETVRGQKVGRRLVDACLQRARDRRVLEVMAITATEDFFLACGFHYTLPGQKKALFIQTRDEM